MIFSANLCDKNDEKLKYVQMRTTLDISAWAFKSPVKKNGVPIYISSVFGHQNNKFSEKCYMKQDRIVGHL